jgi:hypothetical protein
MPRSVECRGQRRQLLSEIVRLRRLVWILAWLGVVCLLLSLRVEARAHHPPQMARNRSEERSRALVSLSSYPVLRSASTKFIRSRAGPRESFFAPNFLLCADDVGPGGPPWLDDRGPPGTSWGPRTSCEAAGHAGSLKRAVELASSPKILPGNGANSKTRTFVTGFS